MTDRLKFLQKVQTAQAFEAREIPIIVERPGKFEHSQCALF